MQPFELILLAASVLVLHLASLIGLAVLVGREARVPRWLRLAIAPGGLRFGRARQVAYVLVALGFVVIGQGLLIAYVAGGKADTFGLLVVSIEFTFAALISFYVLNSR